MGTSGTVAMNVAGDRERELDASRGAWLFRAPESRSLPTSHTGHSIPATCPSVPCETYQLFAFQGARGEEGVLSPHSSQLGQFVVLGRRRPTKPQKAENRASEESMFPRPFPPLSRSRQCAQSDHCPEGCAYGADSNSLEPLPPPPPHSRGSHAVSVPHRPQPAHHCSWMWPEKGGRKDELRVQRGQQSLKMSG